ncbi:MAG: hypothetical protein N2D54_12380 [Chloroflexota bacterium]
MAKNLTKPKKNSDKVSQRIGENKLFFDKFVGPILIGMTIFMIGLIIFAAAVFLGFINF